MKNIIDIYNDNAKHFRLVAVGDALCHANLYRACKNTGYAHILSDYKLDKNDLNFYNQESIIGYGKFHGSYSKMVNLRMQAHFNSLPDFANTFIDKGFNMVSLANNHTLDTEGKGVEHSVKYWKGKNVIYAGQYLNDKERFEERIYTKNGIKFAFFAYTTKDNSKYNDPNHPYYRNDFDYVLAESDIKAVRDKVDVIIVSIHWGSEHTFTPNQEQRDIANFLADLGVDIVLGHHAHCIQPVVKIKNTWVAYSLGNFLASQATTMLSTEIALQLTVDVKKTTNGIELQPSGRLTYFYRSPNRDSFKLMYLDKTPDTVLPNVKSILTEYWHAVTKYCEIPYMT